MDYQSFLGHSHVWIRCCGIIRKSLDWITSRRCGGRSLEFRDMVVTIEGDKLVPYAGNIGMALVNQFEKVAINFNDCFVVFE